MQRDQAIDSLATLDVLESRRRFRKLLTYFPDDGPLRRELYQRHLEFFDAGREYRERCFMAGNRVGKTESAGGYELTLHLLGYYPHWWTGRRFNRPIKAWAVGKTNQTTREILQSKMCGPIKFRETRKAVEGTGLIPADRIKQPTWKSGIPDSIDELPILHASGGHSRLWFKSYEQGRGAFEGSEIDVILLDEEPPMDIYNECLIRTADTTGGGGGGIIMLTFTPLDGITDVVLSFMGEDMRPAEL